MDTEGTYQRRKTKLNIDQGTLQEGYQETALDLLYRDPVLQLRLLNDRNLRTWLSPQAIMVLSQTAPHTKHSMKKKPTDKAKHSLNLVFQKTDETRVTKVLS